MAIPSQSDIGLPLLEVLSNGKLIHYKKIEKKLSKIFGLGEKEENMVKSSGHERLVLNRIRWSIFYLGKAGLVDRPKMAHVQISEEGKKVLKSKPKKVNYAFLNTIPKFSEWIKSLNKK